MIRHEGIDTGHDTENNTQEFIDIFINLYLFLLENISLHIFIPINI